MQKLNRNEIDIISSWLGVQLQNTPETRAFKMN